MGTLAALLWYFREEVARYALAGLRSYQTRRLDDDARLAWAIAIGTVIDLVVYVVAFVSLLRG